MMQEYAIIVAGGSGTRMNSDIPKQFLLLGNRPILMHTIEAFHRYSEKVKIILVLPEPDVQRWKKLCDEHQFDCRHDIVKGGRSRFQSVRNGLQKVQFNGTVAIHDGVRPLVHPDIIGASFKLAAIHGSAIAAVRLKESIRKVDKDETRAKDRSKYRLIQTPQTFKSELILKAFELDEQEIFTDDASVFEMAGFKISLFEGSYKNIKITTPEDLLIAEAILASRK